MTSTYQKFLKTNIPLAPLGIEFDKERAVYFCTPKGASVIGWAGVDGIHYCFIRGFGEMVFAVCPMNSAPEYVHPLAKNFSDFLRLLLACGDVSLLEQARMWKQEQFENCIRENLITAEQKKILAEIMEKMNLSAMERPYQYVKDLQSSFDYSKIKYTKGFYALDINLTAEPSAREWKVYFDGDFWESHGRNRPGKEIAIKKQFSWADRKWSIPAIYLCAKGLVIDFCFQVDPVQIRAFTERWERHTETGHCQPLSQEQKMKRNLDNPFLFPLEVCAAVNGKVLQNSHTCGIYYDPCQSRDTENPAEVQRVMEHYCLDPSHGWMMTRAMFPWKTKRRPKIKALSLTIKQRPVSIPGPHFHVAAPGACVEFFCPVSGKRHTLTVLEYEQQTIPIPLNTFGQEELEYPTYCHTMRYTIFPTLSNDTLTITDCSNGDRPKRRQTAVSRSPASRCTTDTMIIGSADGPTVLFFCGQKDGNTIYSAPHFAPVEEVEWRIVFHKKQFSDITITLTEDIP